MDPENYKELTEHNEALRVIKNWSFMILRNPAFLVICDKGH